MNFFIDTDWVILTCCDAGKGRSQLPLPFISVHYLVIQLKFTSIKHHFHNILLEQISGYGTILSANSWHLGLKMNDDRPEANHFHNSTLTAAVEILRQKTHQWSIWNTFAGAKCCKWYTSIYKITEIDRTRVYADPIAFIRFLLYASIC